MPRPEDTQWRKPSPRTPAPQIDPVFLWPTPNTKDFLFYVERNGDLPANQKFAYGDPFLDRGRYPDHKLVYVSPQSQDKWSRWYYASDRINEDEYNWSITSGEQLVRTYFVKRSLYYERTEEEAEAADPQIPDEFTHPIAGTLDERFTKYGFADDTVSDAPEELAGLYIIVRRRFIEPVVSDLRWEPAFNRYVRTTREIIPPEVYPTPPVRVAGQTIQVKQGNSFHDVRITEELLAEPDGSDPPFPYQKPSIPDYRNFNFPSRLDAVELVYAYAWAVSNRDAPSYSEDFYFKYEITDPRPAPYGATLERWITDDPEAFKAAHPLTPIPAPLRETTAIVYAWATAGIANRTQAVAREQQLPPTIHRQINVTVDGEELPEDAEVTRAFTSSFPETPGYTAFAALTEATVGYEVRELPFELFEVTLIKLDITNLYGEPSSVSSLRRITLSAGTLSPPFAPATLNYTVSVLNAVTSITVAPFTSDPYSTVEVNNLPVVSGSESSPIALVVGANTIEIVVTSQDETTTTTYTITVTRA